MRAAAVAGLLPLLLLTLIGPVCAAESGGLTEQEAAGQEIYQSGTSPSGGEILAVMAGGTELPAASLPCSGCHGEHGRGNPEGGVHPTDLSWQALTRPYGVRSQRGREHGPYTAESLARAIGEGVDPAGNELHVAMPRYHMSDEDMAALVAYLQQLGRGRRDWDPGIGPERLRLGTLLPPAGFMGGVGEAIESVLRAWVAALDERGGLYGRHVELVPFTLPPDPAEWKTAVGDFLDREPVFALVGAFIAGGEEDLTALLRERRVPLIGPFTQRPQIERPVNPQVFYLLPGVEIQARALLSFALHLDRPEDEIANEEAGALPVATVMHPEDDAELTALAEELVAEGRRQGWERLGERTFKAGAVDALRLASALATIGSRVIFFLGDSADRQYLLEGSDHFNWRPEVYTPGAMAGPEALRTPPAFDDRFFLAFPTLPDDRTPQALEAYRALAAEHDLPRRHGTTQLTTLAAARLFEEGAKRAGRELSRAKLVAKLEELYKWDSGLTPLLTYNPNRRIGARGAHILVLDLDDKTFRRRGGWVEVETE